MRNGPCSSQPGVWVSRIGVGLVLSLITSGCSSSRCAVDCAPGYEPVPNACTCRPVSDAGGTDARDAAGKNDGPIPGDGSRAAVDAGADGGLDGSPPTSRKRVFHLLNGDLGVIRDANGPRTGLEVADAQCTSAGQSYGGGHWRAWLSSSTVNAIDRLVDVGPWYRLDQQTELFENRAALARGPLVAIEDPTDAGSGLRSLFWTGTLIDGTASATNCSDWSAYVGGVTATVGRTDMAGAGWVDSSPLSCSKYLSLLCFEQ